MATVGLDMLELLLAFPSGWPAPISSSVSITMGSIAEHAERNINLFSLCWILIYGFHYEAKLLLAQQFWLLPAGGALMAFLLQPRKGPTLAA